MKIRKYTISLRKVLCIPMIATLSFWGCSKTEAPNKDTPPSHSSEKPSEVNQASISKESIKPPFSKFSVESITDQKIKKEFSEVPIDLIFDSIEKHLNLTKEEFETTDTFRKRADAKLITPYYESLNLTDLVIFSAPVGSSGTAYEYDADKKLFRVYATETAVPTQFNRAGRFNLRKSVPNKLEIFYERAGQSIQLAGTGQNAFGAKADVELTSFNRYGLASGSMPFLKFEHNAYMVSLKSTVLAELKIDADRAKALKSDLSMLVVFQLRDPYIITNSFGSAPTMSNPKGMSVTYKYLYGDVVDIIFYSNASGEIVSRIPRTAKRK